MRCLDVGCGVGGVARTIARHSGAIIVGLNINDYQLSKAGKLGVQQKLDHLVSYQKGDFMKQPFDDNTFDAVYQCEATCHAPVRFLPFHAVAVLAESSSQAQSFHLHIHPPDYFGFRTKLDATLKSTGF